ncbi:MAG: hypothetical protein OEM38_04515, partial [Gammaproteobacteria bacterium]|nr:hypothetical protein [Gammaproteobacteria bacterium]
LFSYSIGHIFLYAPSLRAKTPSRPWKAEGRTMQEQLSRPEAKSKHAEQLQYNKQYTSLFFTKGLCKYSLEALFSNDHHKITS